VTCAAKSLLLTQGIKQIKMKHDLWNIYPQTAEEFRPRINISLWKQHKTGILVHMVKTFCLLWKCRLQLITQTSLAYQIRLFAHLNRWMPHGAKQPSRTRERSTFTHWFTVCVCAQPADNTRLKQQPTTWSEFSITFICL